MADRSTPTQTMTLSETQQQFSRVVNRVFRRQARVLVEKRGIPVAALVSIDDLRRLEQLDAEWEQGFAVLDHVGAAFADATPETLARETATALAAVRATARAEREASSHP